MRRIALVLFAFVAACSSATEATTTISSATTLAPPTTEAVTTTTEAVTTTTEPLPASPINGLGVENEENLARRVVAIKIDNHANARPQSGLDLAEAVIEVPVEGITRFIALFNTTDAEYLGPVRSGRPSDGRLLNPLNATMAISGGQDWIIAGLRREVEGILGENRPEMFRTDRAAPHDLYTNTLLLRDVADGRDYSNDPPPPWWTFGEMPATADRASQVVMHFGNSFNVTWTYDQAARNYQRNFNGSPAEGFDPEFNRYPITADTMIVIIAPRYTERAPAGGTSVPAMDTNGTGAAYVFANGRVTEGTWARESSEELFVLTTADGDEMVVPPGYLWVSVVPEQNGIEFE